ncbi:hypothetical protein [Phycicoccus sp. Soil748]|uniref:hypothetical protein n=1 Tax=Phycicoccus sp. Soil748 TaxID=1736397 RepID=UPI000702C134|nr:hypothetical protein [Phycicoccus sp. Soil748]KRE55447.1 hypothetical protein ASG70_08790 [Phycicoccus sp. Soil748]
MTHQPAPTGRDRAWYEIRLQGQLGTHWATRFDGMTLTALEDGTTVLHGPVADQAALHGLLRQLGDIGITLLSVHQHDPATSTTPATEQGD